MSTIIEKLNEIFNIKNNIKQAIANKGVDIPDNTPFANYPNKIDAIESGGGADPYYETLWNSVINNGNRCKYLFYDCNQLITLDLSNLNTSNVTSMEAMFYNCQSLTSLDVSNWDTGNVTSMSSMFSGCQSLASLDVSHLNTSNVTTMQSMFYNCQSLTSLDISNWDTGNVTSMNSMFAGCKLLASLDMSNCDVSKCVSSGMSTNGFASMFGVMSTNACKELVDFKAPKNISSNLDVQYCTKLTHDSLMSIINNLATVTSSKTLTLGTTNLAKLTEEEKAIATNKGWTVK